MRTGHWLILIAGAIASLAACGDPSAPSLRFEGAYHLAGCSSAGGAPPCVMLATGSSHMYIYADSARVVFAPDGSVSWRDWTTTTIDSCYFSGSSCPSSSHGADTLTGSYQVENDQIVLALMSGAGIATTRSLKAWPLGSKPDSLIGKVLEDSYSASVFRP